MKIARIYLRVSTDDQDLTRQESLIESTKATGFYIACVYREKASGASADRPQLLKLIEDLQPGEVVVSEKIDRLTRLPLPEAERLIASIQAKGARLAIPGVIDLSELISGSDGIAKIVLEAVQAMLLRLALQMSRDDYENRRKRQSEGIALAKNAHKFKGRKPDLILHQRVIALRLAGTSIAKTAILAGCSVSQVKRISALQNNNNKVRQDNAGPKPQQAGI